MPHHAKKETLRQRTYRGSIFYNKAFRFFFVSSFSVAEIRSRATLDFQIFCIRSTLRIVLQDVVFETDTVRVMLSVINRIATNASYFVSI